MQRGARADGWPLSPRSRRAPTPAARAPQVYRDESARPRGATAHPADFHLVYRHNGHAGFAPVTLWEPVAPAGYAALGTLAVGAPDMPAPGDALCVRRDRVARTVFFDAPLWTCEPAALQVLYPSPNHVCSGRGQPRLWPCGALRSGGGACAVASARARARRARGGRRCARSVPAAGARSACTGASRASKGRASACKPAVCAPLHRGTPDTLARPRASAACSCGGTSVVRGRLLRAHWRAPPASPAPRAAC